MTNTTKYHSGITPHYVTENILFVKSVPDKNGGTIPEIERYPDIPLSWCNQKCGGFRFQHFNEAPCCSMKTCFYSPKLYLRTLLERSEYVSVCSVCERVYVKTSRNTRGQPETCRSDECDLAYIRTENSNDHKCIVCLTPCTRRATITDGFFRYAYNDKIFMGNQYVVCARCDPLLRGTIDEELGKMIREALDSDEDSAVSAEVETKIRGWLARHEKNTKQ